MSVSNFINAKSKWVSVVQRSVYLNSYSFFHSLTSSHSSCRYRGVIFAPGHTHWYTHTHTHTPTHEFGRTPLNVWSVQCIDLYLKTPNTHNIQISMPTVVIEPAIPARKRPQPLALDRAATGIDLKSCNMRKNIHTLEPSDNMYWNTPYCGTVLIGLYVSILRSWARHRKTFRGIKRERLEKAHFSCEPNTFQTLNGLDIYIYTRVYSFHVSLPPY
jgi:hypothetical protein